MEEWELDDFVEEVKFQMTEYEELTEEIILDWEQKARNWVITNGDRKKGITKRGKDILIKVMDEDMMYKIAEKFYKAVKNNQSVQYWKKFTL